MTDDICFRPLSRWIGSYTDIALNLHHWGFCFRPLSRWIGSYTPDFVVGFKNKHKI